MSAHARLNLAERTALLIGADDNLGEGLFIRTYGGATACDPSSPLESAGTTCVPSEIVHSFRNTDAILRGYLTDLDRPPRPCRSSGADLHGGQAAGPVQVGVSVVDRFLHADVERLPPGRRSTGSRPVPVNRSAGEPGETFVGGRKELVMNARPTLPAAPVISIRGTAVTTFAALPSRHQARHKIRQDIGVF